MQKRIIIAALAAAVSAPALAENSNINVYGVLHASLESVKNDKPLANTASSLNRIVSNASRLGVKGKEDLGDGLAAIWQLEAQFDLTNSGGTPFATTRNSQVGLEGGFGTAFYGNWDTPYKVAHNKVELFDNTHTASALDITGRVGIADGNASFNTRQKNVLQYWTPNFDGFQAKLAYAPDNAKKSTVNVATGGDKSVWSLSAVYDKDALYAAYAYESHKDALAGVGSTVSLTDTANRLVGAYKIGDSQIGLTYERLTVAKAATSTTTDSRNGWELSGKYRFGANSLGAFYSRAGDLGGVANTGANQYSLRYGYNLSKRTELYGFYTALSNDAAASYNFSANTTVASAAGAAGLGAKLSGFGLGLAHSF